ncbi:MAG: Asp-tRNA(Asn)/Glu-tRNA(Gln) amidotransferase subunit GatB [Halanaerobium sp.]|nr:Asp-tRNA(Asn)/Glu-tRNA(Gln) amidotransferase subunit GatB [Halanaerobium sp.]
MSSLLEKYDIVIGLEVHAQLLTDSKIFCGCSTGFGAEPNANTCPVCLGLPGVLPVLNKKAVEYIIRTGLAFNCQIAGFSKFDRKNYYYPDLPKSYQISQYDLPLCTDGYIQVAEEDGQNHRIGITRIHLEEDAGKLVHEGTIAESAGTLVDFNRTGVPLIEIVSEPDITSPSLARAYLNKLKNILEYLGVSDCNMEEGSLRCDANLSLKPKGSSTLGTKTELKNMNSFRAVERALAYEAERQASLLTEGGEVMQETRTWDEKAGKTFSMRSKEAAHDYRYFPEPDLVPLVIEAGWIEEIRAALPELPDEKQERFVRQYGLPEYDASVLTGTRALADFFEETVSGYPDAKQASNWMMGDFLYFMREEGLTIREVPFSGKDLARMLEMQEDGTISSKIAKTVLEEMFKTGKAPQKIVEEKGLVQISDEEKLTELVEEVLAENPEAVADYHNGKDRAIGFLVGQIMKATRGKANPQLVNQLLRERLAE